MGSEISRDLWNEQPVHEVTISKPFLVTETEVTIDQFRLFRKEFQGTAGFEPYAAGVSWHDAVAFARWLSRKEGRTYRLPTEAEWEYVARAGSEEVPAGSRELGRPNAWGVKNMLSGPREWCHDGFGEYPRGASGRSGGAGVRIDPSRPGGIAGHRGAEPPEDQFCTAPEPSGHRPFLRTVPAQRRRRPHSRHRLGAGRSLVQQHRPHQRPGEDGDHAPGQQLAERSERRRQLVRAMARVHRGPANGRRDLSRGDRQSVPPGDRWPGRRRCLGDARARVGAGRSPERSVAHGGPVVRPARGSTTTSAWSGAGSGGSARWCRAPP